MYPLSPQLPFRRASDLKPGHHACFVYDTEGEHRAVIASFLREGLARNEKLLYLHDAHSSALVVDCLSDQPQIGKRLLERQLVVREASPAYVPTGAFSPEHMINALWTETNEALADGYAGLRVTGEMTWALAGLPGSDRLAEYEAKLHDFFSTNPCVALCQYDRRRFGPRQLLDVLLAHPVVAIGEAFYDNVHHLLPATFLRQDLRRAAARRWLGALVDHLDDAMASQRGQQALDAFVRDLQHPASS